MGHKGIYTCLSCGNEFMTRVGGGWCFALYRCIKCDRAREVTTSEGINEVNREPTPKQIGRCPSCGGKLRADLEPMCRRCGNRDVELKEVDTYYD